MLELKDVIAVSSGSACTTANPESSHVLQAIGLSEESIKSVVRFGIGRFNTASELDEVIPKIINAVEVLRRLSTGI